MSISNAFKLLCLGLCWLALESRAESASNRPTWLTIAFGTDGVPLVEEHPSLASTLKREVSRGLLIEGRLALNTTLYGIFRETHTSRPLYGELSALIGFLPGDKVSVELATGLGAVIGQKEGELYFYHRWGNGWFPKKTKEYRQLVFADFGFPLVVRWSPTWLSDHKLGLDFSTLWSSEIFRWNLGISFQFHIGGKTPAIIKLVAPQPQVNPIYESPPGPVREELDE